MRVLRPGGHLIVFTVFASDRLEPKEAELLFGGNLALVRVNLDETHVEHVFDRAGLAVTVTDVVGTESRYGEERKHPPHAISSDLRGSAASDQIIEQAGEGHLPARRIESSLARLPVPRQALPTLYVLRKSA